ncbi:MAG: hypothetical protein DBX44_01115 [Oscillospiraceae bacterium]|nr:MAG: hypothetical protein DBX44_01115 [Oscillospiraceae bacterium]
MQRSGREIFCRYLLFIVSLFFMALGVAITRRGELGVSPISSVANVMSLKYASVSLGSWLVIWNCILILGQILLLRRNFSKIQLLQLPLSLLFGYFTDWGTRAVAALPVTSYLTQLLLVAAGTVVLGFGVSLSVIADVIMNSGEAFVKALSDLIRRDFSSVKIVFDLSCVVLSLLLSLTFFDGSILGTREGTLIAALCTGLVVKLLSPLLSPSLNRLLAVNRSA